MPKRYIVYYCLIIIICLYILILFFPQRAMASPPPTINSTDLWRNDLPKVTYLGKFYITGYQPMDGSQCGKSQDSPNLDIGANGKRIIPGEHIAMYKTYPFGTKIYIKGFGLYTVEDRGVGPNKIDIAFHTRAECFAATGYYQTYLIE